MSIPRLRPEFAWCIVSEPRPRGGSQERRHPNFEDEMRIEKLMMVTGLGLAIGLAGCSSQEASAASGDGASAPPAETAPAAAAATTGTVVEVKMVTDGAQNYFEPQNVTVSRGDVVRFVLVSGVHNVSFPAASNAGAGALPGAVPYLQQPGQSHDLSIELPAGEYTFQCDPHAVLGMVGKLTVR